MIGDKLSKLDECENKESFEDNLDKPSKLIKKDDVKYINGLENLQNTCFINSVIQSLKNLPGFRKIIRLSAEFEPLIDGKYFEKIRDIVNSLIYSENSLKSNITFVSFIRTKLNIFNQIGEHGIYMQQVFNLLRFFIWS